MNKKLYFIICLLFSLKSFSQQIDKKDDNIIASIGLNIGLAGSGETYIASEEFKPSDLTSELLNFELAFKKRIKDNSNFFGGLNVNYTKATPVNIIDENDKFNYKNNIFSIGPSLTFYLKNDKGTIANTFSFIPNYTYIKYENLINNQVYKTMDASGLGIKFEYNLNFYLKDNMSIGPKISIQSTKFKNFNEKILIEDPNNFKIDRFSHLQMQLGIIYNIHF
jgi:hypothetical protein